MGERNKFWVHSKKDRLKKEMSKKGREKKIGRVKRFRSLNQLYKFSDILEPVFDAQKCIYIGFPSWKCLHD